MREIKFRAWDKVDKRFIKPYHLCFMHGKSIYDDGHFVCVMGCDGNLFPKDRIILMQFTGLKDKNRKEIYEGDILEVESFPHTSGMEIVKYTNGGFEPFVIVDWEFQADHKTCKVIGNIYENTELLEKINGKS